MLSQQLEEFLAELAKKQKMAVGYHPGNAGDILPQVLERDAQALENDPRIESVDRKFASGKLMQLWVTLE